MRAVDLQAVEKLRVIVVMGVSGSGKTTVAKLLAERHGGHFYDADDFHPDTNIQKMAAGIPLNDKDRVPWLTRLKIEVIDQTPPGSLAVMACSALRKSYRERLGVGRDGVALVYLKGDVPTLSKRLESRVGHFMKTAMLESQLKTLEEPTVGEGVRVNIALPLEDVILAIDLALNL